MMVAPKILPSIALLLVVGCKAQTTKAATIPGDALRGNAVRVEKPVLTSARLSTKTDGDNKDKDTGVYAYVYTANGATKLAQIENADNSDQDATEYNNGSPHTLDLTVLSASPKSDCSNFSFKIGSKANGNDQWKIENATIELHFSDGTNLTRETGAFTLNSRGSQYTEKAF